MQPTTSARAKRSGLNGRINVLVGSIISPADIRFLRRFLDDWGLGEELSGLAMPERYEKERGRLLDTMVDAHKLLADVRATVSGDTEMVLGITRVMTELGMRSQIVATGATNSAFAKKAAEIAPGCKVMIGADF
jgi:nitrogenase molybdenum-iron protein alpha/beta subunit